MTMEIIRTKLHALKDQLQLEAVLPHSPGQY